MVREKKIVFIGFNKTGTTSLHHAFLAAGYRSIHWDYGKLAKRIFSNFSRGSDLFCGYEEYQVFSDGFFLDNKTYLNVGRLFEEMLRIPNVYCIYQYRDPNAFARSRCNHRKYNVKPSFSKRYKKLFGFENLHDSYILEEETFRKRIIDYQGSSTPGARLYMLNMDATDKLKNLNKHLTCLRLTNLTSLENVNKTNTLIAR